MNKPTDLIQRAMRNAWATGVNPYDSHTTYAPKWEQAWKRQAAYLAEKQARNDARFAF